jgi:hypothetical protein
MDNKVKVKVRFDKELDREVAEIFVTRISHCQVCSADFNNLEIVYFAVIDNNIVCTECSEEHFQKEPRIYIR